MPRNAITARVYALAPAVLKSLPVVHGPIALLAPSAPVWIRRYAPPAPSASPATPQIRYRTQGFMRPSLFRAAVVTLAFHRHRIVAGALDRQVLREGLVVVGIGPGHRHGLALEAPGADPVLAVEAAAAAEADRAPRGAIAVGRPPATPQHRPGDAARRGFRVRRRGRRR